MDYPNFIFRSVLISVDNELGRDDQARASLGQLVETYPSLEVGMEWFFGVGPLAEACASLGAEDHAHALYEALVPYADYNVFAHPEVARGSASRHLGLLAATMSRWDDAVHHLERALELNTRMGARPWVAHGQHDYARMLLARSASGDRARARELLSAALETFRELGMKPWEARATADLARLG
jgi:tetratricopeptide (TPR) repeat protein